MSEEDSRTKQDLIFEVSKLNSQLSDEIIKNEQLQQENKELKERIDTVRNMLWSIEYCTLTRERLNQLDEELLGDK